MYYDDQIYRAAGLSPKALRDSEALQKIIKAGSDKTMRLFENLTSTTADQWPPRRSWRTALDAAYMDITSEARFLTKTQ
ncbi:MAG: phage minor capsid protein [Oscillospiraceae bacterium]